MLEPSLLGTMLVPNPTINKELYHIREFDLRLGSVAPALHVFSIYALCV